MSQHYVLFTGGREPDPSVRDDIEAVLRLLRGLHGGTLRVLHGDARGVDTWAQELCDEMGITVKAYPADWGQGRRAGLDRNVKMISNVVSWMALGHTAQVVAFPGGRSVEHLTKTAEACGLDVSHLIAEESK